MGCGSQNTSIDLMLDRAHGSWFIWAVASQSVAVVAADLQPFVLQYE